MAYWQWPEWRSRAVNQAEPETKCGDPIKNGVCLRHFSGLLSSQRYHSPFFLATITMAAAQGLSDSLTIPSCSVLQTALSHASWRADRDDTLWGGRILYKSHAPPAEYAQPHPHSKEKLSLTLDKSSHNSSGPCYTMLVEAGAVRRGLSGITSPST